jgi:uncharacterized membrane protein
MNMLVLGLVIFLGVHSVRIVADGWRSVQIARFGENAWKLSYSLLSLIGFGLLVWGFGLARQEVHHLWSPPAGLRHASATLTLLAFILVTATYVPRNAIKALVHHPMLLGVQIWALAHLLIGGTVAQVTLFGSFLAWAVLCYLAARKRDRTAGTVYPPGTSGATAVTVIAGGAAWALFAFWLHGLLIGVRPFG